MEQTLILSDYTPLPDGKEIKQFCRDLQNSLDDDPSGVIILGQNKKEETAPCVFKTFAGKLMTQSYAGVLSFQGQTIRINSRFDADGEPHFLRYAFEAVPLEESYLRLLTQMDAPMELGAFSPLVVHLFLRQLNHAFALGTYRQYHTFYHNDSKLRGAIDISRHIRLNPMKNGSIAYSTRDYTMDNTINHLIMAAEQCLMSNEAYSQTYRGLLGKNPSLGAPFEALHQALGYPDWNHSAMQQLLQCVSTPITHPFHQRYEAVRKTAIWILRGQGTSPLSLGGAKVSGVLIPMPRLWELFLEHKVLKVSDDGEADLQKALGDMKAQEDLQVMIDGTKPRRIFTIDYILGAKQVDGGLRADMVLDAKYRADWSKPPRKKDGVWVDGVREDVFQVLSYMLVTQAKKGGVIYPTHQEASLGIHQVYPALPHRFYTMPVQIPSSKDLSYEEYCDKIEIACQRVKNQMRQIVEDSLI